MAPPPSPKDASLAGPGTTRGVPLTELPRYRSNSAGNQEDHSLKHWLDFLRRSLDGDRPGGQHVPSLERGSGAEADVVSTGEVGKQARRGGPGVGDRDRACCKGAREESRAYFDDGRIERRDPFSLKWAFAPLSFQADLPVLGHRGRGKRGKKAGGGRGGVMDMNMPAFNHSPTPTQKSTPTLGRKISSVSGKDARLLDESCAPLQDILMQTLEGDAVSCVAAEEEGVFLAQVPAQTEFVLIRAVIHPLFDKAKVFLDEMPVLASEFSLVELDREGSHFSLAVTYFEDPKTLVQDQYALRVEPGQSASEVERTAPEGEAAAGRGGEGRGESQVTSPGELLEPRNLKVQLDDEIQNMRSLEEQLTLLEQHFAINAGAADLISSACDQAEQTAGMGAAGEIGGAARRLLDKPERRVTPTSPLDLYPERSSSVSEGKMMESDAWVDQQLGGLELSPLKGLPRSPGDSRTTVVSLRTETSRLLTSDLQATGGTPSSQLDNTRERIQSMRHALQTSATRRRSEEEGRLSKAFHRISNLEQQMAAQGHQARQENLQLKSEFASGLSTAREELSTKQDVFEQSITSKLLDMQKSFQSSSQSFYAKIDEEKRLIEEKSRAIEHQLCAKVDQMKEVVREVQRDNAASHSRLGRRMDDLQAFNEQTAKRMAQFEQAASGLHDRLGVSDRKVKYMELALGEFKSGVQGDIATLEELLHNEKKERQIEDGEIIGALNMYVESSMQETNMP